MSLNHLVNSIKESEGCKLKVYKCPKGVNTIGYGRNLEDRGISQEEANYLLRNDIKEIKLDLTRYISFFLNLDEVRQSVLIEMAYNIGVAGLVKFKRTLDFIAIGHYTKASIEMLNSKWHRDFISYAPNTPIENLRSSRLAKIMKDGY